MKIFKNLLKNHCANFNQTWHKVSFGKGNSFSHEELFNSQKRGNDILLRLQKWTMTTMTLSIETVSQVSYVVHGPLVNSAALISDVAYTLYVRC